MWNSGAAMWVRQPWRSGIRESSETAASMPASLRGAPLGVPVVPEVRITIRRVALRAGAVGVGAGLDQRLEGGVPVDLAVGPGEDRVGRCGRPEELGELLVVDDRRSASRAPGRRPAAARRTRCSGRGCPRRAWRRRRVASTKPRWLRHIRATESPSDDPELRQRRGRARWSAGAARRRSATPSSSTRPTCRGRDRQGGEAARRPGPPAAQRRPMPASTAGVHGRTIPDSVRTFRPVPVAAARPQDGSEHGSPSRGGSGVRRASSGRRAGSPTSPCSPRPSWSGRARRSGPPR